jgi:hypothetical protein
MSQPTVPWWTILITAVVSVLATVYATRPGPKPTLGTPVLPSFGSLITDTLTYIPHILLLFGILADMFTYQGVYSIPSLVGLLSIPLNWLFKFFWVGMFDTLGRVADILASKPMEGGAAAYNFAGVDSESLFRRTTGTSTGTGTGPAKSSFFKDYDGCTVQGFSWAASPYTPQTLVVTATVFSYYIFDLIMNRGWENASAAIVFFFILFLGETAVVGNCVVDNLEINKYLRALMAFSEGLLFGGSAYAVVQAYFPTFLPSSAIYPFPRVNVRDLKKNAAGQYVDDQGRPYIKGPNDQAIPDVSSKDGQSSWGSIYGQATGSPNMSFASGGVAAANCPAKK